MEFYFKNKLNLNDEPLFLCSCIMVWPIIIFYINDKINFDGFMKLIYKDLNPYSTIELFKNADKRFKIFNIDLFKIINKSPFMKNFESIFR